MSFDLEKEAHLFVWIHSNDEIGNGYDILPKFLKKHFKYRYISWGCRKLNLLKQLTKVPLT